MTLLDWLYSMVKKRDTEAEIISRAISNVSRRHEAAKNRLEKLTALEVSRRESLQLQSEVMSRQSRRG